MNYITVVNTVFGILFGILGILALHFVFFAIVGIFTKKTFPKTDQKLKYGVIIPARNEEMVVSGLIESIQKCKYPQDKLQIFVIAHNCTDHTAEIARATGATVYEYNNPNECTMGYAFRHLFDCIRRDWGTENYDGFFLFNADNIVSEDYFDKMNDAFVACDKKSVITSLRNSKNFGTNLMTVMYGLYFLYGCRFESRGRTALGCSTRVQGTGYVINSELVKDGWKYVTLTEDWEFTRDQVLKDIPIVYCDEAVFYDEQPTNFRTMWRQRVRWARGHLLVCLSGFGNLLRGLFRSPEHNGTRKKFSTFDITVNILPVCVISIFLAILHLTMLSFSPFFGTSLWDAYHIWMLFTVCSTGFTYVSMVFASFILYIVERKHIHGVSVPLAILSLFVWPLFLILSMPAEVVALFSKNLGWKPIPHNDVSRISDIKARRELKKKSKQEKNAEKAEKENNTPYSGDISGNK